jgi:hypothetical protein
VRPPDRPVHPSLQAPVIWHAVCNSAERVDLFRVVSWKKENVMQNKLELCRQVLKAKINEAVATTGLRDSIRIQRAADAIDMTQQAAEREMAMQNLHREASLGYGALR